MQLMAQQSGGLGAPSSFRASSTITSSEDSCLATMKQEEGLGLSMECPPLSSLTASLHAKDCSIEEKVRGGVATWTTHYHKWSKGGKG